MQTQAIKSRSLQLATAGIAAVLLSSVSISGLTGCNPSSTADNKTSRSTHASNSAPARDDLAHRFDLTAIRAARGGGIRCVR